MGVTLLQLVYTSIATRPFSSQEMADLCAQSARNNGVDEITGFLLTRGDRFLQALEGPREAVENTFIRIIKDPRHHGVVVLSRRLLTRREFGEWEMAYYQDFADHEAVLAHVARLTERSPESVRKAFSELVWMRDEADATRRRFS